MPETPRLTIVEFRKLFPDNAACLDFLFRAHHGETKCSKCGETGQYYRNRGTSRYVCQCGASQISPKAGTIFEKSDTDLVKWFFAIFLMSQSRNGVTAKELERQLGVTYKTAWRMAQLIRPLLREAPALATGEVEADEAIAGVDRPGKRGGAGGAKASVFGTAQRNSQRRTPSVQADAIERLLTRKLLEREELQRQIQALRIAAKLVQEVGDAESGDRGAQAAEIEGSQGPDRFNRPGLLGR